MCGGDGELTSPLLAYDITHDNRPGFDDGSRLFLKTVQVSAHVLVGVVDWPSDGRSNPGLHFFASQ